MKNGQIFQCQGLLLHLLCFGEDISEQDIPIFCLLSPRKWRFFLPRHGKSCDFWKIKKKIEEEDCSSNPREVENKIMHFPSLEKSKARLGGAWNNLGQWKVSSILWHWMDFRVSSSPNCSLFLWKAESFGDLSSWFEFENLLYCPEAAFLGNP